MAKFSGSKAHATAIHRLEASNDIHHLTNAEHYHYEQNLTSRPRSSAYVLFSIYIYQI